MPLSDLDRARIALKPRRTRRQWIVGVMCALLGFVMVGTVQTNDTTGVLASARESDLLQILDDLTQRRARLEEETRVLTSARDQLLSGSAEQVIAQTRDRVRALSVLAGTVPVYGPGLRIRITDPQGVIDSSIILDAVEELRDAGAEAIDINGRRVVVNSWFADGRERGISIDGVVVTSPYVITAIGEGDTMAAAMRIPGGVADAVNAAGANFAATSLQDVTIDSIVQPHKPRYAAATS
ncbi:MAG: DUF881 domain-containing protein [Candidatus Nanopelagicales bacterium]